MFLRTPLHFLKSTPWFHPPARCPCQQPCELRQTFRFLRTERPILSAYFRKFAFNYRMTEQG